MRGLTSLAQIVHESCHFWVSTPTQWTPAEELLPKNQHMKQKMECTNLPRSKSEGKEMILTTQNWVRKRQRSTRVMYRNFEEKKNFTSHNHQDNHADATWQSKLGWNPNLEFDFSVGSVCYLSGLSHKPSEHGHAADLRFSIALTIGIDTRSFQCTTHSGFPVLKYKIF